MFKIIWSGPALTDAVAIIDYVAEQEGNAVAADKIIKQIERAAKSLSRDPHRCRIVPELRDQGIDHYREISINPYRIAFRVEGRNVIIVAALNGRRDLLELLLRRAMDRP